jgi:glycosyltransferase involved in cell wall biosynthesis
MLINIILPIYRPNDKIYEAIDSVLAQTYTNWHLYIVDDASNDNSLNKIKDNYQLYNYKISYFQFDKNRRAAACRNYAIFKGSGQFITFIDQDDVWVPNKLELQIEKIQTFGADAVHGNLKLIDNDNKIIFPDKWEKENQTRRDVDWKNLSGEKLARHIFMRPNIRIISSMVSREVFEKIGGFKEQFFGGEDETFWFEVALVGKIAFIDEILFYRREHNFNTVDRFKFERLKGYTNAIIYLRKRHPFLTQGIYNDKFAAKLNAQAKYYIKRRQYVLVLTYIFKWFTCNPAYLLKLSIFRNLPFNKKN